MPIGKAMPQVRMIAAIEITMVSHSRSPITSVTGRFHSRDTPKSPRTTRLIHFQYCTQIGWLRPYCSRIASASWALTIEPEEESLAM